MRALQFTEFGPVSNLHLIELPDPKAGTATAIVKVAAGAISPSDVKNVEGKMEHTTLPRVPGRDYAGTVVQGPGSNGLARRSGEPVARSAIRSMAATRNSWQFQSRACGASPRGYH